MNELADFVVASVAALLGGVFAMGDSALLAFHAAEGEPPAGGTFAERERQHRALSMARVLAYLIAGAAFAQALDLPSLGIAPRIAVMILVSLVACTVTEGIGRAIGALGAPTLFERFQPLIRGVTIVLRPAVALGTAIDRAVNVFIPVVSDAEERETSTEQFREVVASEADVSSAEEALIHGVFTLGETEVHEIMIPRVDIVGIDDTTPWSEVLDRIRSSEHARFPVYHETLDEVIGILYAKDVLPAIIADEEPELGWLSLVRRPVFIPISKHIDDQLRDFQASRNHIAIVSDEYGGTAGLVTIEDILEEIVGEIRDEYDVEEPEIRQEGSTRYWVSGRVTLDELSDVLDADMRAEDVTTVGGLVYSLFDRVPAPGESLIHPRGFRIVVERVRRRRIERVYFERLAAAPSAKADE
jgi:CBS domain containing-hemolysin-like protein